MGGGLLAGKPKPTSCPLPRPLSTSFQPRPLMQAMGLDCIIYNGSELAGKDSASACLSRPETLLVRQHRIHGSSGAVLSPNAT